MAKKLKDQLEETKEREIVKAWNQMSDPSLRKVADATGYNKDTCKKILNRNGIDTGRD